MDADDQVIGSPAVSVSPAVADPEPLDPNRRLISITVEEAAQLMGIPVEELWRRRADLLAGRYLPHDEAMALVESADPEPPDTLGVLRLPSSTPPHKRAYAEMLGGGKPKRPAKHRPGARYVRPQHNIRREERRSIEALYAETMGRPMSSRTWRYVRKALKRDWIKGSTSNAARFFQALNRKEAAS